MNVILPLRGSTLRTPSVLASGADVIETFGISVTKLIVEELAISFSKVTKTTEESSFVIAISVLAIGPVGVIAGSTTEIRNS